MEAQASEPSAGSAHISIINPRDPSIHFELRLPEASSIADVKNRISQNYPGHPRPENQVLIAAGRNLGNEETVASLVAQQGTPRVVIRLVIHPGSPPPPPVPDIATAKAGLLEAEEKQQGIAPASVSFSLTGSMPPASSLHSTTAAAAAELALPAQPAGLSEAPGPTSTLDAAAYLQYCQLWENQQYLWWIQLLSHDPPQYASQYVWGCAPHPLHAGTTREDGNVSELRRRLRPNPWEAEAQPPLGAEGAAQPLPAEARLDDAAPRAAAEGPAGHAPGGAEERRFIVNLQPFLFIRLLFMVFLFAQRGHMWRNIMIACLAFAFYLYQTGIVAVCVALCCPWLLPNEPPAAGAPGEAVPPGDPAAPEQGVDRPQQVRAGLDPLPVEPADPEWLRQQPGGVDRDAPPPAVPEGPPHRFAAVVRRAVLEFFTSLVPSREPPAPVPQDQLPGAVAAAAGDEAPPPQLAEPEPVFG